MLIVAIGLGVAAVAGVVVAAVVSRRSHRSLDRTRQDATERIAAAEGERAARDAILRTLDEGILLFDPGGRVLYRNARADELLGRPVETLAALTPPMLGELVAAVSAGRNFEPAEVAAGASGPLLRAVGSVLPDGHVVLRLRDVTQARHLDAVRRDFVTNASHELKTPAASIQALSETILDASAEDPRSVPRFAEQLRRETDRLARIVTDLLDLSRLEGGQGETTAVRLDNLARDEAERLVERAHRAGLSLEVTGPEPLTVEGSERDLRLLVRNLVENALQYTGAGGRIEVATESQDGQAVLVVRDTGIGIPARERGRVFERFYRVDRARSRETGGTGLGLSIVKHVAENHGGTVTVQSQLGTGSAFTVRLPLAAEVRKPS